MRTGLPNIRRRHSAPRSCTSATPGCGPPSMGTTTNAARATQLCRCSPRTSDQRPRRAQRAVRQSGTASLDAAGLARPDRGDRRAGSAGRRGRSARPLRRRHRLANLLLHGRAIALNESITAIGLASATRRSGWAFRAASRQRPSPRLLVLRALGAARRPTSRPRADRQCRGHVRSGVAGPAEDQGAGTEGHRLQRVLSLRKQAHDQGLSRRALIAGAVSAPA